MVNDPWFWGFLVLGVPAYWSSPDRYRLALLSALSIGYLVRLEPVGTSVLLGLTALVYLVSPTGPNVPARTWIVPTLVIGLLGYLAYFKYVPRLLAAVSGEPALAQVAMPLGISYFTFKLVHYVVERSRGTLGTHDVWTFCSYIVLVPIFSAGPIERFDHYLGHREAAWRAQSAAEGMTRIAHGLIKKFLIADLVVLPLLASVRSGGELAASLPDLPTWKVWAFCVRSFLYLYLDFSAYSDVAIGASRLFGLSIMENFNWPIVAPNISDFWKRWHMTLAGWCQSYVYMPTIGLTRNPYVATYATFLAIGAWHAASSGWLLWGLYHATGISIYGTWSRVCRRRKWRGLDRPGLRWVGMAATFAFVAAGASLTATDGQGPWAALRVLAKLLFIDLPA